jgi:hypothetical protein
MASQAKANAQHSLAPQPKHSIELNKSEFDIWSAKAMQEMENIFQVCDRLLFILYLKLFVVSTLQFLCAVVYFCLSF